MKEKLIISGLIFLLGFAAGLLIPPSCGNGSTFTGLTKYIVKHDTVARYIPQITLKAESKKPARVVRAYGSDSAKAVGLFAAVDSAFAELQKIGASELHYDTLATAHLDTLAITSNAISKQILIDLKKSEKETTINSTLNLPIAKEPAFYEKAWFGVVVGVVSTIGIAWAVRELK